MLLLFAERLQIWSQTGKRFQSRGRI